LVLAACALALSAVDALAGTREIAPDLGGRTQLDLSDGQAVVPVTKGERALAPKFDPSLRPTSGCGDEPRGQLGWISEDDPVAEHKSELARIAGTEGMVARKGLRLVLTPSAGSPLTFTDWNKPATGSADGEMRMYYYAGTMPGSDYVRVEVHYGHDAPGSYLIEPHTGALAYVHNGGQVGALSGDGHRVATFEPLNEPYRLAIATLEPLAPRVEIECRFNEVTRELHAHACGWLDHERFELSWAKDGAAPVPMLLELQKGRWELRIGASAAPVGVHCMAFDHKR
jgi:hypothetical protein